MVCLLVCVCVTILGDAVWQRDRMKLVSAEKRAEVTEGRGGQDKEKESERSKMGQER